MTDNEAICLALSIDRLILRTRLADISLLAQTEQRERVGSVAAVLSKLRPGAYLLGCGPYCCGILPLTVEAVVLGRPPSPLEVLPDTVVDYPLNDAVWMVPREVSRVHASVLRRPASGAVEYAIRDEHSRLGTFVNGRQVGMDADGQPTTALTVLAHGDVISLGPSGVNSYVFIEIGPGGLPPTEEKG